MLRESRYYCPECDDGSDRPHVPSRRTFLRSAAGGAAALAVGGAVLPRVAAAEEAKRPARPAEELIRELHSNLSAEQKKEVVYAFDHGGNRPTRLGTYNSPALDKRIGDTYTKGQQELVERIVRAMMADDEAFDRLSREGKWDGSESFDGCGALLFGDPTEGSKFAFLFSGHHLTIRCDGNSEPGAAFGGPMYYGHIINGYSSRNVYHYQTEQVHSVYDALDEEQRKKAVAENNPGDGMRGIQFPPKDQAKPGISYGDLKPDQRELVATVMRTLIDPFRKEEGDEVMQIIKANGGMEKIHLAFYRDAGREDQVRWHFWRLEGPGFIWNYRVLPHVHCFVNIATA